MTHRHLGRLPPLQAIGRSQCVEDDEPPDISDSEVNQFLAEAAGQDAPYYYETQHSDSAAQALSQQFRVLNPGSHVCKKISENSSSFTHCKYGVAFANKYCQLRQLMETRARLQLVRDYASRINALTIFVKDIERIVREECKMWYNICHNTLTEAPETKLEYLSAICEELRVHMNHWSSIKQLLHTDRWLRPLLPQLLSEMNHVRVKLLHLRNLTIWWIHCFIQTGLRVLAHSDLERATDESLWGITRGIEDFGAIVNAVQSESQQNDSLLNCMSDRQLTSHSCHLKLSSLLKLSGASAMNSYRNLADGIRPISVKDLLSLVASERCKYAGVVTHQFFASSSELLRVVLKKRLVEYSWCEDFRSRLQDGTRSQMNTSDYHSATGSHISVNTSLLRVGGLLAPDLSHHSSPLIDFARREHQFAQKFLQMICHSTKLLKKSPKASQHRKLSLSVGSSQDNCPSVCRRENGAVMIDTASLVEPVGSGPSNSKNHVTLRVECKDIKRKSVSWGDATEASLIQQLTHHYMESLWQHFATALLHFLHNPVWGGVDATQGQLGSVTLWPDVVVIMLVKMIQQTCVKDLFPPSSVQSLYSVGKSLQVFTAWAAWDKSFNKALASRVTDKCLPTPLTDGDYSTRTGKLLRDTFQPLQTMLETLDLTALDDQSENDKVCSKNPTLTVLTPSLQRLVVTCDVAANWCNCKARGLLSARTLGAFLLVTQSDLKLLGDEVRRALNTCHSLCISQYHGKSHLEACLYKERTQLWQHLNDINAQMQTLSGAVVKQFSEDCLDQSLEFFEDAMPPGSKIWRKKSTQDMPSRHQDYVEEATASLLDPVVSGVCQLKTTSQLSAVSMAVTALGEAWTQHILKHKIKFSLYGASQLQYDFAYLQMWLQTHIQNEEVQQSILALDIFKYLSGAVELLKRQPRGRTRSRTPIGRRRVRDNASCEASMTVSSSDQMGSTGGTTSGSEGGSDPDMKDSRPHSANPTPQASNGGLDPDLANYKMPHVEQWLALRVHGGARGWPKLPSCFQPSTSQM